MEVFCRNVPEHLKQKHLKKALKPILAEFEIYVFECRKQKNGHATLTIVDENKARAFLAKYPKGQRGQRLKPWQTLLLMNIPIFIEEGRYKPNEFLLRSLREEEDRYQQSTTNQSLTRAVKDHPQKQRSFYITSLSCGVFDYDHETPLFVEYFNIRNEGKVVFRRGGLEATIGIPTNPSAQYQVEISYWDVNGSVYLGDTHTPSLVVPCSAAPRLFSKRHQVTSWEQMRFRESLHWLAVNPKALQDKTLTKTRLTALGSEHEHIVSSCFTYRFLLKSANDLRVVHNLANESYMPPFDTWVDIKRAPQLPYTKQLGHFLISLRRQDFPYRVCFQLQMLVWNGVLTAGNVEALFEYTRQLLSRVSVYDAVKVFRKFLRRVQSPSPQVDSADLSHSNLVRLLMDIEEGRELRYPDPEKDWVLHGQQAAIHRATVTPTGIYLYGPYPETQNRVLRRYCSFDDHFLRVEFTEESGDQVVYDSSTNLDVIFDGRFRQVLRDGIIIADRHFHFLGFSHSSLRARTCWFMASFTVNGQCIDTNGMIERLGDFRHIFSPAKYAARIGQTFSDTFFSIAVDKKAIYTAPDIERNGRIFSDGCGTISKQILWKIHRDYLRRTKVRPTVFQIRLSGAKGMLSLDASKSGSQIMLRESMVKFEAPYDWNIEICGSGTTKLPFYLNAQIIKILEDLGVSPAVFLSLQADEVENLWQMNQSHQKTAAYLEQAHIARSTRLPWLIRTLASMNLDYKEDDFLKQVVEIVVLMRLRELKYRSRIKVPKAYTLYGIMDETGFLNEGEIFCPVLNGQSHREILVQKDVVVTRSPALHPGDVQLVSAVDVPVDSPLRQLHNCVVFSQKGSRDLASQLSGGDLDGDLFNIIFDTRLRPLKVSPPADYSREGDLILDRPVELSDIADFFITFMRQDQLGRIATIHKILADQCPNGTFEKQCIRLAELHSIAVDFSKTGKPVNVLQIPRSPPCRPDFMAPGPRVRIADTLEAIMLELNDDPDNDNDEDDEKLNSSRVRYYKSERVLGQLYRAIDEKAFLDKVARSQNTGTLRVLDSVWRYVEKETDGFLWDHHMEDAKNVMEIYEDNLRDLMYQYSDVPWKSSLSEVEVFVGSIMGENHRQSRRQIEDSKNLREDFDRLVEWTNSMIVDKTSEFDDHLERSIACFHVALDAAKLASQNNSRQLRSFPWVAAVACIHEIDKLRASTFPFS